MKRLLITSYTASLLMFCLSAHAVAPEVVQLQSAWEHANYELSGKPQIEAFEHLITEADKTRQQLPAQADVLIWRGIIYASYAGKKGGLGALSMAKTAKADLEKAIEIDKQALNGSAYTTLGTLYYKVPGWPLGFGDNAIAEKMLKEALTINPQGIDSNYFYALYLIEKQQCAEAEKFLLKAQQAAPRPERPLADKGRHQEIDQALATVKKHMAEQKHASTVN
jgi:tetratricopeptide (TPR) repeat protein